MLFLSYARKERSVLTAALDRETGVLLSGGKTQNHTEYTRELVHSVPGWVFESHQMKPGTGGLKGAEFSQIS